MSERFPFKCAQGHGHVSARIAAACDEQSALERERTKTVTLTVREAAIVYGKLEAAANEEYQRALVHAERARLRREGPTAKIEEARKKLAMERHAELKAIARKLQ
jgi:hypothetical protein